MRPGFYGRVQIAAVIIDMYCHRPDSLWSDVADDSLSLSLSFFSMHARADALERTTHPPRSLALRARTNRADALVRRSAPQGASVNSDSQSVTCKRWWGHGYGYVVGVVCRRAHCFY